MDDLTFSQFISRFPDNTACLEEIKKLRFPSGIFCSLCQRITKHYKLANRTAYACQHCRRQVYPLAGTIFAKTTTPLRLWFYAMYLLTQTRAGISIRQLQHELGVTYKTAWRIYHQLYMLMEQHNGDLLNDFSENKIHRWVFFNKLELKVVDRQESSS